MERLADRVEGLEGEALLNAILEMMDEGRRRVLAVEDRIALLEMSRPFTPDQVMLVSLNDRMASLEARLDRLLARFC